MKNKISKLTALLALSGALAQATPPFTEPPSANPPVSILETIKPGLYQGMGTWKDELGRGGSFLDQTEITAYSVRAGVLVDTTLSWKNSAGLMQDKKMSFSAMDDAQNGFFSVTTADPVKIVGDGYCYAAQCSLRVSNGIVSVEETLTFSNMKLYKLGSKTENGKKIVWQSELIKR